MQTPLRIAVILISVAFFTGCARSLPLISHAHIGHSLTAWRDTPNEQGLFVVAEKETNVALAQAKLAHQMSDNPVLSRQHVDNVVNALNPDINAQGPRLGYGAIRALQGSVDHIQFAATTEDASDNIVQHAAVFSESGTSLLSRLQVALEVAQLAREASDSELPGLNEELQQQLQQCVSGDDVEVGLIQLRQQLSSMIDKEKNPPYHPLGRRYLLGLVRLPNGTWKYDFNNPDSRYAGGAGGGSGGGSGGY